MDNLREECLLSKDQLLETRFCLGEEGQSSKEKTADTLCVTVQLIVYNLI